MDLSKVIDGKSTMHFLAVVDNFTCSSSVLGVTMKNVLRDDCMNLSSFLELHLCLAWSVP
jgi:hypothetical protein